MKRLFTGLAVCLLSLPALSDPMDIHLAFDRAKGEIYAIYRRALQSHPGLKGKLVLDIDISAAGAVTDCRVVSNELTPEVGTSICARVREIQIGPQPSSSTVRKPLEFFPAT